MFRILQRTEKDADEEKGKMKGMDSTRGSTTVAHHLLDTVEGIASSQRSTDGRDILVLTGKFGMPQERSTTIDDKFKDIAVDDRRVGSDRPAGMAESLLDMESERHVIPSAKHARHKCIQTIVRDSPYTTHNIDCNSNPTSGNEMGGKTYTRANTVATFRQLRHDLGDLLDYLPGVDELDWRTDEDDERYIPFTLRIGFFTSKSKFKGRIPWVFFKRRTSDLANPPHMELFVCKRNGQYIDNGASARFHTYYRDIKLDQFEACIDREDVITLAKYFVLLAKGTAGNLWED
tara:strand:+ start:6088 stop:6957 length:870 start_codon:yes stop_codon:yes gene_type:complete